MNKILQEDFDLAPCMVAGYESFMNGLLNIVHSGPICESVGEQIKSYVLDFVQNHPLDSFDRFSDETYMRNYIGRDTESGWEAIVMSWKKETVRPFMLILNLLVTRLPMGSSWLRFLNLLKRGFVWFKR